MEAFSRIFHRPHGPIKYLTYAACIVAVERLYHGVIQPVRSSKQVDALLAPGGAKFEPITPAQAAATARRHRDSANLISTDLTWEQLEGAAPTKDDRTVAYEQDKANQLLEEKGSAWAVQQPVAAYR